MPQIWNSKATGHEYIRIMRAKVEAGTATEDEKWFLAGNYKSDREWTKAETRKLDKLFNQMFPYKQCIECGAKIKRTFKGELCAKCHLEQKKIEKEVNVIL
jgi:Zn finger protein HypA/HybF involved in hydrogenase expression